MDDGNIPVDYKKLLDLCSAKDRRIQQLESELKQEKKLHRKCRRLANRRKQSLMKKTQTIHTVKMKSKEKASVEKKDKKLLNAIKKNPTLLESVQNGFTKKQGRRYKTSCPLATRQMLASSSAYRTLRAEGVLTLPHPKSVVRWRRHISNLPGFNSEIIKIVKNAATTMAEKDKVVAVLIDGMALKPFIDYHAMSDRIFGFPDNGRLAADEQNSTENLATEAVVVMIRSLHAKFKQVIGYFLANSTLGSQCLKDIIIEAIQILQNIGLYPVVVIMDQHPTNVKVAQELGVTNQQTEFFVNSKETVIMFDPPHAFKGFRNNWLAKNILVNGKVASFSYVRDLHHMDLKNTPRLAPHLIRKAVYPNTFEKMNVKLAVRTLSRTTAKAIETSISLNMMNKEAKATAELINMMDQYFDIFNSRFVLDNTKPIRSAITENSEQWAKLDEIQDVIKHIIFVPNDCLDAEQALRGSERLSTSQKTPPSVNALIHNISALKKIWQIVSTKHNFEYLKTNKLNQDPLENDFSCVRRSCGNNDTPNAQQFGVALKIGCIKKTFSNTNCENDNNVSVVGSAPSNYSKAEDPLAECDEFITRPFDPLDEAPEVEAIETNALAYVVGYTVAKLTHKKCKKNLRQQAGEDKSEYIFCALKQYHNSENFVIPSENAMKIGTEVHNAFKQKFHKFLTINRKGLKLRLREYVDYGNYSDIICCICFNKIINRLLNTLIKSEVRKMQQSIRRKTAKRNGKARRMGLAQKVAHGRRSKLKKKRKSRSTKNPEPDLEVQLSYISGLRTEFVDCANTEGCDDDETTADGRGLSLLEFVNCCDLDCEQYADNNLNEGENSRKGQTALEPRPEHTDPDLQKMEESIQVLEKLLQALPQRDHIDIEKRDCHHLTITEINATLPQFHQELKDLYDKFKTCSSFELSKSDLLSFEEVSSIFTEDQLYAMVLHLDHSLVSAEETGLINDIIDTVLVYEWGIRIFTKVHNFSCRQEALTHIKLQEEAEIYN